MAMVRYLSSLCNFAGVCLSIADEHRWLDVHLGAQDLPLEAPGELADPRLA